MITRFTKQQLNVLDGMVLADLHKRSHKVSYVIKNSISMHQKQNFTTAQILRSCRRLEARGLVEISPCFSYRVMKLWNITPLGVAEVTEGKNDT